LHPGLPYFITAALLIAASVFVGYLGTTKSSGQVIPAGATISAEQLRTEAIETSRQILLFVSDRKIHEPQQSDYFSRDTFTPGLWDKWTTDLINYSQETKQLYYEKYDGNVKYLRDQFQKWGLSQTDLDQLCMDATNYIVITQGAVALDMLARQLIPKQ